MWLPWPLWLCFNPKPNVAEEPVADCCVSSDAQPSTPVHSPPGRVQPLPESPVPLQAQPEGHEELPSKGIEDANTTVPRNCMTHRPKQLSVDDVDLEDIRSPNPTLQRTPIPATPQSASSVRSTLEILRTPMPFGSPVPDPARMTPTLAQALEKRQPEQLEPEPDTPMLLRVNTSSLASKRPSPLQSNSCANQANPFQTPSPLQSNTRYAISQSDPDSTPHVTGLSNPATVYKENKAVRLRHTPFTERVDKEVQKERAFSEQLSCEKVEELQAQAA